MAAPSATASETPVDTQSRVQQEMATLINPDTGDRRPVEVGSQGAQQLFGQGYVLEQSPNVPAAGAVQATTGRTTSGQPITSAGKFVDVVNQMAQNKIKEKRESLLNAPENYDTQLDLQVGSLYAALADEAVALTPENLRWLTPDQQRLVRQGDKDTIKSAIIGLNSIKQSREDRRKEEQARIEREREVALARFETLLSLNAAQDMSLTQKEQVVQALGLSDVGALDQIITRQSQSDQFSYELRSTDQGVIEIRKDADTGRVLDTRVISGDGGFVASANPNLSTGETLAVGSTFNSGLGSGTITAYGSPIWGPGLDVHLRS